jgi:hypothetical protein
VTAADVERSLGREPAKLIEARKGLEERYAQLQRQELSPDEFVERAFNRAADGLKAYWAVHASWERLYQPGAWPELANQVFDKSLHESENALVREEEARADALNRLSGKEREAAWEQLRRAHTAAREKQFAAVATEYTANLDYLISERKRLITATWALYDFAVERSHGKDDAFATGAQTLKKDVLDGQFVMQGKLAADYRLATPYSTWVSSMIRSNNDWCTKRPFPEIQFKSKAPEPDDCYIIGMQKLAEPSVDSLHAATQQANKKPPSACPDPPLAPCLGKDSACRERLRGECEAARARGCTSGLEVCQAVVCEKLKVLYEPARIPAGTWTRPTSIEPLPAGCVPPQDHPVYHFYVPDHREDDVRVNIYRVGSYNFLRPGTYRIEVSAYEPALHGSADIVVEPIPCRYVGLLANNSSPTGSFSVGESDVLSFHYLPPDCIVPSAPRRVTSSRPDVATITDDGLAVFVSAVKIGESDIVVRHGTLESFPYRIAVSLQPCREVQVRYSSLTVIVGQELVGPIVEYVPDVCEGKYDTAFTIRGDGTSRLASIDGSSGTLRGLREGRVTVEVSAKNKNGGRVRATTDVTVVAPPLCQEISANYERYTIKVGESLPPPKLSYLPAGCEAPNAELVFDGNPLTSAFVLPDGDIVGTAPGSVIVTISRGDRLKTDVKIEVLRKD